MPDLRPEPEGIESLSSRERECLRLVQQGMSSKEIGLALRLSSHTVDNYLKSSIRKLETRIAAPPPAVWRRLRRMIQQSRIGCTKQWLWSRRPGL